MKLVIANIQIHQDAEGRFSLNDLHKASGGEERHSPDRFLRLEQTQSLVDEISNSPEMENKDGTAGTPAVVTKAGRYGGSFGCKEVVYAYANWISPAFYLKMIRTFDAVVTGNLEEAQKIAKPRAPQLHAKVRAGIMIIESAAKMLKFSDAALLGCYQRLSAMTESSGLLPNYAFDAPQGSNAVSAEVCHSATFLLKEHGVKISTMRFNLALQEHGFIRKETRPSKSKGKSSYWSVVNLEFGKNAVSPENEKETQPLWYDCKFAELLEIVLPAGTEQIVRGDLWKRASIFLR